MNHQRLQSYINLIQNLLACPSGEEWIVLRQNEALVTPELVQVMEQVATQLAHQGNGQEAKFLHNLAGQIHHLFVAQTVPRTNSDDQSQAYLELIKALLVVPKGSEEELLAANQELIGPGLVHMLRQVAAELAANGDQGRASYLQHWATELNRIWVQQHDFQSSLPKEPEKKHPDAKSAVMPPTAIAPSARPGPVPHAAVAEAPSETSPMSSPAMVTDEDDFWADPGSKPVPASVPVSVNDEDMPATPAQPPPGQSGEQNGRQKGMPSHAVSPASAIHASVTDEPINHPLQTIAAALSKLAETLATQVQPPANPLWYMDVLERAYTGKWVLTSAEIHQLVGVQPVSHRESDSFQRGCWVFVKAGKVGSHMGWRVTKAETGEG